MSDFSAFKSAIRKEDLENVKRTFKKEYINLKDDSGWTPLHWACGYNKSIDIVKYLIDEGCDIEAETVNNRWRPLHLAVFNGYSSLVTELIDRGCLLDSTASSGQTPLDLAMEWRKENCANIIQKVRKNSMSEGKMVSAIQNNLGPSLTNYKKGNLLGRGGFGQVFKCFDQETGQDFAMKEVLLNIGDKIGPDVKALENEIAIYKRLSCHPRIVQYYGTSTDAESMYIFMEYMTGGSIKDQLNQYGTLVPKIISRYVKQILEGLAFLHQKVIIHRDIKSSNILRGADGNVKLSDFGTCRYLSTISVSATGKMSNFSTVNNGSKKELSETRTLCGTFYWMAPEVIRSEKYNTSADIWSLGATVIEMLTGNPPYHDLEPYAALFKIGNSKKIVYQLPNPISKELQSFLNRMLESNHRKRANVEELLKSDFILGVTNV